MKKKEIWKDIKGFEGLYQVSNLGVVRSKLRPRSTGTVKSDDWHIIQESLLDNDAPRVNLRGVDGNHTGYRYVARLVLETFIGPPPTDKHLALRLDGKIQNVELDNLKWGTYKDIKTLLKINGTMPRGEMLPQHILSSEDVIEIKEELINGFLTLKEISECYPVDVSAIASIKSNDNWKHIPWPEGEINQFTHRKCSCCGDQFRTPRFPSGPIRKYCSTQCQSRYNYLKSTGKTYEEVYAQ